MISKISEQTPANQEFFMKDAGQLMIRIEDGFKQYLLDSTKLEVQLKSKTYYYDSNSALKYNSKLYDFEPCSHNSNLKFSESYINRVIIK